MVIDPRYEAELKQGEYYAHLMLECGATYKVSLRALRFYFVRVALVRGSGKFVPTAAALGTSPGSLRIMAKPVVLRPGEIALTSSAKINAERWATHLATEDATLKYREALFIWSRSLLLAAIDRAKGNRMEASRKLKVHRNVLWRVPSSPEQTKQIGTGRQAKPAA
jgi:hypothetical protein